MQIREIFQRDLQTMLLVCRGIVSFCSAHVPLRCKINYLLLSEIFLTVYTENTVLDLRMAILGSVANNLVIFIEAEFL